MQNVTRQVWCLAKESWLIVAAGIRLLARFVYKMRRVTAVIFMVYMYKILYDIRMACLCVVCRKSYRKYNCNIIYVHIWRKIMNGLQSQGISAHYRYCHRSGCRRRRPTDAIIIYVRLIFSDTVDDKQWTARKQIEKKTELEILNKCRVIYMYKLLQKCYV